MDVLFFLHARLAIRSRPSRGRSGICVEIRKVGRKKAGFSIEIRTREGQML